METPKWKGFAFWYWGFPVISKVFPVISICHCLSVRVRQWSFSRTAQGPRKSKDSWECQRHNPAAMWWTRPDAMQSPIRVKRRHVCPQHHAGLQAHSGIVFTTWSWGGLRAKHATNKCQICSFLKDHCCTNQSKNWVRPWDMADRNKRMEPRNLEKHVEKLHSMVSQLVVPGRDSPWNWTKLASKYGYASEIQGAANNRFWHFKDKHQNCRDAYSKKN